LSGPTFRISRARSEAQRVGSRSVRALGGIRPVVSLFGYACLK